MSFRAFVGVPVPEEPAVVALLDGLAATRADLKVVPPQNLHVTLSFLGQVPDESAGPLSRALDAAVAGQPRFRARLQGVGAFPSASRPRVVWAGMEDPAPLAALAARVRSELAAAGHPGDDKDFRAHLTLARTRSQRGIDDLVAFLRQHARDPLPEVEVRDVRLYRSRLAPGGPSYEAVHVAPLEA